MNDKIVNVIDSLRLLCSDFAKSQTGVKLTKKTNSYYCSVAFVLMVIRWGFIHIQWIPPYGHLVIVATSHILESQTVESFLILPRHYGH